MIKQLWPTTENMYTVFGVNLYDSGRMEEAMQIYQATFKEDFKWMYLYMAYILGIDDNADKLSVAEKVCKLALAANPRDMFAGLALGFLLDEQGNIDEAIEVIKSVVERNPKSSEGYFRLGYLKNRQEKLEEGIESYRTAINLNPQDAATYCNMGCALSQLEKWQESLEAYTMAIQINPKKCQRIF